VAVDLTNVTTYANACGGVNKALKLPSKVDGNPGVGGLQPVVPGEDINFKIGPSCGGGSQYDVEVKADGVSIFHQTLTTCTFQVTIPLGADVVEVIVNTVVLGAGETPYQGTATWEGLQSIGLANNTPYPTITVTRPAGYLAPTPAELCTMISWQWSAFYEGREQAMIDLVNLDLALFGIWADGDPTKASQITYFQFITPDPALTTWTSAQKAMLADGTLDPALRLRHGIELANPLSVASHYPLYVQGDYNKQDWKPAALIGDAITILSNAWKDSDHQAQTIIKTDAADTEVYAAILAGHKATPCDHEDPGCAGGYTDFYGGGIENFPRFLEKWSGIRLTYSGALVSIHESVIANSTWTGTYYSPPVRDWSFDTRFQDPRNLPPGTPVVGNVLHTAFRPVY
jgi:hypothetical protein